MNGQSRGVFVLTRCELAALLTAQYLAARDRPADYRQAILDLAAAINVTLSVPARAECVTVDAAGTVV